MGSRLMVIKPFSVPDLLIHSGWFTQRLGLAVVTTVGQSERTNRAAPLAKSKKGYRSKTNGTISPAPIVRMMGSLFSTLTEKRLVEIGVTVAPLIKAGDLGPELG